MWKKIKNIYHLGIAILANVFYSFPSQKLRIIGVTGTDGKTTTANLIYHILNSAGFNASMVTSVGAVIGGKSYDVGFHITTPSSFAIQRFIKKAVDSGSKFLVLETTSHALDQYRVFGVKYEAGVLTNVTHEHLDYHKTYENYVKTKAKLLKMSKTAIVNKDDGSYKLISNFKFLISKLRTYGMDKNADINPKTFPFKTNLIGEFNKYNVLAAISACKALGISEKAIRKGIESFVPPKGREDIIYPSAGSEQADFTVMIDFAHTPNAIEQILKSIRPDVKGKIIHLFGSAGARDVTKRPLMGELSSKYADIVILTAEDPRSEKVSAIMDDITSGIQNSEVRIKNGTLYRVEDRKKAIETAIKMAKKGDFVLLTGKSHEKSMNYGYGEEPWDEYEVAKEALRLRSKIKSIHFVGIKGVGMTPLAIIAKEAGINVSGSDIPDEFITDVVLKKAGITPLIGFSKNHISNPDLVITTGAHGGFNNIEVLGAKSKNIRVITQGEAVGVFMEGSIFGRTFTGISVTGTHGKTTTTAMIATLLKINNFDPSFLIGTADAVSLGAPGHYGKGDFFVAEADEYMTEPTFDRTIKHMWQHPKIAVITNIEFDHPDAYDSLENTREEFLKFANQLPDQGVLITCGDDPQVKKLLSEFKGRRITYGTSNDNDFVLRDVLKDVKLSVFGEHNQLNATASFIVGLEVGLSKEQIKKGLSIFEGSKRRSEFIGTLRSGALLFDDYAHHPTEIQKTLKAFRERFPNSQIVCVFQPHTYSRTKSLFEQFSDSFKDVNTVILTNIYSSLREKPDLTISMEDLAGKIGKKALFLPKLSDVVKYINDQGYGNNVVLITMGAGDVYKISEKLELQK